MKKAFTLLEILLVIAAIGILAAIVIVAINPQRQLAQVRDSERQSDLNTLNSALQQYLIDEGAYPPAIASLPVGVTREICAGGVSEGDCESTGKVFLESALVPRHLAAIPRGPNTSGDETSYQVYRKGTGRLAFLTNGENIEFISLNVDGSFQRPFVLRIQTDNPGTSEDNQFTLPLTGGGYNYTIDWGDGTVEENITDGTNRTHTYPSPGIYTIAITGDFPRIHFNNNDDRRKAIELMQWGDISWSSMVHAFNGAQNMSISASDTPDLSNVTNASNMLRGSTDLSNVNFDQWDMSNIERVTNMFFGSDIRNIDVSTWDTSSFLYIEQMFRNTSQLQTLNVSNWDVTSVITAHGFLLNSSVQEVNFTGWNTANIETMQNMFQNTDISNLSQIESWDVSSVRNMNRMFSNSQNVPDVSNWNITSATNISEMFQNSSLSNSQYQSILTNWSQLPVQSNLNFHAGNAQYSAATQSARDTLTNTFGWTITDGGLQP